MKSWRDDPDWGDPPPAGPRLCPRCGRSEPRGSTLCHECGEVLQGQGFCGICEDFWPLPVGAFCPKHEVGLETQRHSWPLSLEAGERPVWVTVGVFADPPKAEAPRIRLEAEGIPTFLEGERMGSHSMYAVATGGVKLQVPQALEADARILLAQSWTPSMIEEEDLEGAWDDLAPDPGALMRSIMRGVIVFLLICPFLMTLISMFTGR